MSIVNEKKLSSANLSWQLIEVMILVSLLFLDQLSKWWARMHDLIVWNAGGVFGVWPSWWWVVVLVMVWGITVWQWWKMDHSTCRWGMGFIVMGGLGNILDRMWFGSVRDFIFYPGFGFYGNVADIWLAIGVLMIMVSKVKSPDS